MTAPSEHKTNMPGAERYRSFWKSNIRPAVNGPAGMKQSTPERFRAGGKPRDRVCKQSPEQTIRALCSELILSVSACI